MRFAPAFGIFRTARADAAPLDASREASMVINPLPGW